MINDSKMESHEHKRQLAQIEANRIATLQMRLRLNPDNKILKNFLDNYSKNNDRQITKGQSHRHQR